MPFENGQRLHDLLTDPFKPLWIEGAGHNDMERLAGSEICHRTQDFLAHCQKRLAGRPKMSYQGESDGYDGAALPVF